MHSISGELAAAAHTDDLSGCVLLLSESRPFSVTTEKGGVHEDCRAVLLNAASGSAKFSGTPRHLIRFRFDPSLFSEQHPFPFEEFGLLKTFFIPQEQPPVALPALFFRTVSDPVCKLARLLLSECSKGAACSHGLCLCCLTALLIELCRCGSIEAEAHEPPASGEFEKIMLYLRENCAAAGLAQVAETFHYHPKTVSALFLRKTGQSFSDIRNGLRLDKAASMIRNGVSVRETAALCGYKNLTNFYSRFELRFGVKPGAYRSGT